MAYKISKAEAQKRVKAVEEALADGFPPIGHSVRETGRNAVTEAARRLGIDRATIWHTVKRNGSAWKMNLRVDWKKFKPKPTIIKEAVEARRDQDRQAELRRRLADAQRHAAAAADYREGILGLAAEPLRPAILPAPSRKSGEGGRSAIAHLSDVHRGETVPLAHVDGVNCYDSKISRARLGRFFSTVSSLCTAHWAGKPPDEVILCLGGDLISGNIHAELVETNEFSLPRQVREVGEDIAGGILLVRREVKRPVRVISVPGNHARDTVKPQSKRRAAHNFDLLAAEFAEAALRGESDVRFYAAAGPDAFFNVYGWNFCLTHGDAMGTGGGKGYIGPIAPITKGHRLIVDNAGKTGRRIHYVLTGHYHTTARTPFGWANGSVVGYGEYARDLRADPEPAKQNLLVCHEKRGVIGHHEIYLGSPEEGRIYTIAGI